MRAMIFVEKKQPAITKPADEIAKTPALKAPAAAKSSTAKPTTAKQSVAKKAAPEKKQSKELILTAAMQLFSSFGYDGTNFRQITERSGAARSLVLYHFKSKEELWRRAVEEIARRFNELIEPRLHMPADISDKERSRRAMRAFIETLIAVPEYGQVMLREGCTQSPRLDWIVANFAPPLALNVRFQNKSVDHRVKRTIVRDVLTSTLLAITTLGPLLDASLAAALHKKNAGIYPLTNSKSEELIELMLKLVFSDDIAE
jgi:AcrR family transcriptional regulator